MEFVSSKKSKNRKRKRNIKNRRRVKRKLEVKATIRRKAFSHASATKNPMDDIMDAHSFWENYKVSQDWQQRHSVAWWKSRCHALEYENNVLRQKVRRQASGLGRYSIPDYAEKMPTDEEATNDNDSNNDSDHDANDDDDEEDDENLEFQVDKDMLDFLEQSIRHKMELKRSRESETVAATSEYNAEMPFVTCEARMRAKAEDAKLLYGGASPCIMAMEAALQATTDRHKDRAKPHYWPNIPLKP